VVKWRETGEEPTEGELFIGDSRSKYYWINREVFVLKKGVLWREGDEGKSARRVVSKMYREQIVKLCHDPPLAGHQGIERTIEKVKEFGVHLLLFLHFVLTWALKTNALCLSNYLDSLDTFPSKSISRFPRRDPDLSHPRSHFFFLLVLTLTHGLTPRFICQGNHVIYILVITGPV
jgi:hypothetical protein